MHNRIPTKEGEKNQHVFFHFHHGPATVPLRGRTCKHGPFAGTPRRGLFSDGINIQQEAGVPGAHSCKFKKILAEGQWCIAPELLIQYLEEEYLSLVWTKKELKNVSFHFKPDPFIVDAKLSASGLHLLSISMKFCQMFRILQANTAIIFSEINTFLCYNFYITNF